LTVLALFNLAGEDGW